MARQRGIGILSATLLALSPAVAGAWALDDTPAPGAVLTIKGNVLCNRATDTKDWFWDPKDGDHTPVIYALDGTPEIAGKVRKIMEGYPDRGLDVDSALEIQEQFTRHLKYFISPLPLAE